MRKYTVFVAIFWVLSMDAQFARSPHVSYVLSIDSADLSSYAIEIHLSNVPKKFKLAMATHHEYDDRFWRFVQNFTVLAPDRNASFKKLDSAVWEVSIPGHSTLIRYKIKLPPQEQFRFAHRPFLSSMGGLVGDIHSFMYLPDFAQIASTVTFRIPESWQLVTGLNPTKNDHVFTAPSADVLLDCPVLVGKLHIWNFVVNAVPHTVAYLPLANASTFDSSTLVRNIQRIAEQAAKLFGGIPYRHYFFLLEDGTNGALEHSNSLTLGASSTILAGNMNELYEQLAHEFFHTWNLMAIKPAEYTPLNYGPQEASAGLWFSEGFTMFYADLFVRRLGLMEASSPDSTRIAHLQHLITRYYSDTGNMVISPTKVSLVSNASPGLLGSYDASVHLQGELIASLLDLLIRNETKNEKTMNDVMSLMFKRFGTSKGFLSSDVERTVTDVCRCDSEVHLFFRSFVYGASGLNFKKYLTLAGLQLKTDYVLARDDHENPVPDVRVYVWLPPGDSVYRIAITNPMSSWSRAGIHTGDMVIALNNRPVGSRQDFYDVIRNLRVNDTLLLTTIRAGLISMTPIPIAAYSIPDVRIAKLPHMTARQSELLKQWEKGN